MTTSIARQRQGRHDPIAASLAQNRLGVPPVTFVELAGAAPLTVIAGGATAGWLVTGVKGIPIAYLAMAAVLAVFAVGYTAMSRHIVNAGAFYSYIAQGLGRIPGVAAAGVALVAYNAMQVGLIGGFGYVGAQTLKTVFHVYTSWWLVAFVGWAAVAVLGVARIDLSGRVLAVLLSAEILISLVYAVVQLAHPAGGHVSFATLAPSQLGEKTMGAGFATAIVGFVGFEATAVYASEARDPRRTVPRATYLALAVIGLLYATCSWAMSVATGPDQIVAQATDKGTELTFSLVAPYLARAWIDAGHLLFVTSLFAAMLAFHNTVVRYGFTLGREGVLPRFMGTATRAAHPDDHHLVRGRRVLRPQGAERREPVGAACRVGAVRARPAVRAVANIPGLPRTAGVQPTNPVRWWLLASFAIAAVLGAARAGWMRHRQADRFAGIGYGTHSELAGVA
jgi:amino acid transporter